MNQDFQIICINAPEGCRHGTHTNGTAYIRGTYSRVHTQTHTNTNKHTTRPDKVLYLCVGVFQAPGLSDTSVTAIKYYLRY